MSDQFLVVAKVKGGRVDFRRKEAIFNRGLVDKIDIIRLRKTNFFLNVITLTVINVLVN